MSSIRTPPKITRQLIPWVLMGAAFLYFVLRDRTPPPEQKPEDVLVQMVLALGDGEVDTFLSCFSGDLGVSLRTIVDQRGEQAISDWLVSRGQRMKGFAILEKETRGESALLVRTETVYEDRNSGQTFLLQRQNRQWKIIQSDFEMVQDWDTDFGKLVVEIE